MHPLEGRFSKISIESIDSHGYPQIEPFCPPTITHRDNNIIACRNTTDDDGIGNNNNYAIHGNETTECIRNIVKSLRLDHLNSEEKENVLNLVKLYHDRFYLPDEYLGKTHVLHHKIITIDESPVNTKQYRFPPVNREEIRTQVNQLLEKEVIKPSTSPYNSPVWIVPKKPDRKS